jgi:serine phosphatase RsbU (regulator of sigma subunit)
MKEINYKKGDILYLYSDGYYDQFGGKYDKKLLCLNFHQILLEIHELPMLKQKEILESRLNDWMMGTDQTDDITVLGIRL